MEHWISSTPTTAQTECATIFVAIELSRSSWVVALHTPLANKIGVHKLTAGDWRALLALIARHRAKAERPLGAPLDVVSCYEAGYDGFWLHRLLLANGVRNHVIDPASLQVNRRARRAKTDRVDATGLLRAVMAWCRGERQVCAMVRAPSVEQEDAKRLHRERRRLVKERTQHVNRITGLLAGQGIYDFQPRRAGALTRLGKLTTGDGRPVPERLRREIERQLQRLTLVQEMIAELEVERDAVLVAPAAEPAAHKIQHLAKLKSIGPETATVLGREIFYRGYDTRRQIGAYAGLAPSPFNSGRMIRDQGISKAGNRRARTTMIELAWLWLRYQPDSALSQWFRERVGGAKGRLKRIMIVALARKLLVALWRYVETGLLPTGAVLKV